MRAFLKTLYSSFRRKPESSIFKGLWIPTGACPVPRHGVGMTFLKVFGILSCLLVSVVHAEPVQFNLKDSVCHSLAADIYVVADRSEQEKATQGLYTAMDHARETCQRLNTEEAASEIAQINEKGEGTYNVSEELSFALEEALKVSGWTDGMFDITYPSGAAVFTIKDFRRLNFNRKKKTLTVKSPGMILDFRYMLRGVLADQIARDLQGHGWKNCFIEISGVTVVRGQDANGPWKVAVDDQSKGAAKHAFRYKVQDIGIATVAAEMLGTLRHPKTKQTITSDLTAATVFTETAAQAEGLAAGLIFLGKDRGLILLKNLPSIQAVLVDKEGKFHRTKKAKAP